MIAIEAAKKFWDSPDVSGMVDNWKTDKDKIRHEHKIAKVVGPVGSLADLGCGAGRFSKVMRCAEYTGYEGSIQMLEIAKAENPGTAFVNVDIFNFQPDKEYEAVMMIDVAQHQMEPIASTERIMDLWKAQRYIFTFVIGESREELLMTTVDSFRNYISYSERYNPTVHAMENCHDGDFLWVLLEVPCQT